jgi:deazaflavin-dependent oxidoreductase (nitroreductase family)
MLVAAAGRVELDASAVSAHHVAPPCQLAVPAAGEGVGLAGRHTYILAVRGRRTGNRHETPVTLIENGDRWLVAPYGEVGWVRNTRAAGEVELTRARRTENVRIEEATPQEAAPVLKRYLNAVAVVRPFFDVAPDSSIEEFIHEAPHHPVFRLLPGSPREGSAPGP